MMKWWDGSCGWGKWGGLRRLRKGIISKERQTIGLSGIWDENDEEIFMDGYPCHLYL